MSDTRKQVSSSPQTCFVSLQNVILSSCLTFCDGVYYRTSDNTFIPISDSEKPVAGNKCYVQSKYIIIHPLTKYLSNDINQCGTTSCHTRNIFINDQSFKSNLTGKECKTISYDRLSCSSTNVIYGIHYVHCGLVYVGESRRSLRSRMNGHRPYQPLKKEDKTYSTDTSINRIILWMT